MCARGPVLVLSMAMPGIKWSTVLLTGSMGMRVTGDQVRPSVEVVMTISFDVQPVRKRQSCHTTYTLPCGSISAEGRGLVRRFPATPWVLTEAAVTALLQLAPPLVETKERIDELLPL